ncbi:protein of unknown function DUF1061 [Paenibacillus mucilaginosus KNP414]|uniref:DNA alkylation repair enzyme n=1 Tax=Paenibacillus mucilaginosus (strain KNP414) TaxID=1036673 RepID=F8FD91_PAEMK|nr:DNA alkylation repair protein [Paenibacillus mucilaginosus]AEI41751.1 protein of unknown function DUF1061 [Paenibacillus mucilaginosus KNP414]
MGLPWGGLFLAWKAYPSTNDTPRLPLLSSSGCAGRECVYCYHNLKEGRIGVTLEEVMKRLEAMGSESTRQTLMRHGMPPAGYGVKVGDLKKLVKPVKGDQELVLQLYDTGISDAMYLAGLTVNPKTVAKETLQAWARKADWYLIAEYTVASAAAESPHALELAREWIDSPEELVAACGWSTWANYVSITPDEHLPAEELRGLLERVQASIHEERNRVRYTMNGFVISVGGYVAPLHEEAVQAAAAIGKVRVNMGGTACKVPSAPEYIARMISAGKLGKKRKTCIC